MLKSLELFGFKSFADRIRFDFSPGITCVVGPNGSGKSNVVDALKWILGDQSPKSLRGKEMTDVIFNGSSGRKPSAFSEATLTFDNSSGMLPIDAQEIQIGRRLWRNGDSEYLINQASARLKDIRDLFMGTGASASAYSIIEQGRVDQILQANASARRAVFEEAAGISRYKSRKVEALRKLDRVDQNLLRLTDIVDEIEAQLNSTRSQASKAAKYREVTEELRESWQGLAADDFRFLSSRLETIDEEVSSYESQIVELNELQSGFENRLAAQDVKIAEVDDRLRQVERTAASNRESNASLETTITYQTTRHQELESEIQRLRKQRSVMDRRLQESVTDSERTTAEASAYAAEFAQQKSSVQSRATQITELATGIQSKKNQLEENHQQLASLTQQSSVLANRISGLQSQLESLETSEKKVDSRKYQLDAEITLCQTECERKQAIVDDLAIQVEACDEQIAEIEARQDTLNTELRQFEKSLAEQREQRSAWQARISVLEDLEKRQEGFGIGVKEILNRAQTSNYPPWNQILGSVADLLEADLEEAALLEVALGNRAQLVVLKEDGPLIEYLENGSYTISGRVGFLPIETDRTNSRPDPSSSPDLSSEPGVVKRADQLAFPTTTIPHLAECLLADTWIVDTLETGLKLSNGLGRGCRFLSLQGELLEVDGTLFVGTVRGETAVVSRKSELRRLKNDLSRLDRKITEEQNQHSNLGRSLSQIDAGLDSSRKESQRLNSLLMAKKSDATAKSQELARFKQDREAIEEEKSRIQAHSQQLQRDVDVAHLEIANAEEDRQNLEAAIENNSREISRLEHRLRSTEEKQQEEQLVLAKREERLTGLQNEQSRLETEVQQRSVQCEEAVRRFDAAILKKRQTALQILNANAVLAEQFLTEEELAQNIALLITEKQELRDQRAQLSKDETHVRQQRRELKDQQHTAEIKARDIRHQVTSLEERIEEEYQLDLTELVNSGVSAFEKYKEELRAQFAPEVEPAPEPELDEHSDIEPADKAAEDQEELEVLDAEASQIESDSENESVDSPTISSTDELGEDISISFEEVRDEIESQVNRLRRKLKMMGSVNTDSLRNLDELEARFQHLNGQLQDLVEAKTTLEEIVRKINIESRRMFIDSFETIRGHFQELFRKLFGGGEGDIILEDAEDVLECGIDIVARPPGKELRSITLLSGGEKTMTAVALLMAIFKSRPSPFCILDEVDAALDEANVDRYTSVVKAFEDSTQFIIITHHKRTMTVADVLYGVTMEDAGVSKRMSVRFEDVSDNGEFRTSGGSSTDVGHAA